MKGSKSISERIYLINNVDKIIFVSKWVQNRFFNGIDKKLIDKTEVVYPSIQKKNLLKKDKNIIFVGKLNGQKDMIFIEMQFKDFR